MTALRSQSERSTPRQAPRHADVPTGGAALERVPLEGSFAWALNPYAGCEQGCAHCPPQLGRIACAELVPAHGAPGPRTQAVQVLIAQLHDVAVRRDRTFSERPILLGTEADPWPAAEREGHLTRQLLEGLAGLPGLDLRCFTRSSLVGRDADLLAQIARRGRVRVTVMVPGLARRAWLALEPHAPSPERRLMAVGLLARAGVEVGVEVGPLLKGFNDAQPELLAVLTRANEAGARFATARPLELSELARERVLALAEQVEPVRASALRRLLVHGSLHDARSWHEARARFRKVCEHLGLEAFPGEQRAVESASTPRQLSLF